MTYLYVCKDCGEFNETESREHGPDVCVVCGSIELRCAESFFEKLPLELQKRVNMDDLEYGNIWEQIS